MHEIAKGMEYLHSEKVLHGDLKGANVLVDDKYRCVISDFGQSEMKSEAFRISGTRPTSRMFIIYYYIIKFRFLTFCHAFP
jgi:serine/threonine protein kinase